MRASIVVGTYNQERFVREAIDSALAQTHDDLEVIVVDDGSTDGTRGIVESYGDRVMAVLKENRGQGSSFNTGFARADGDFVLFLDGDDFLYPDAAVNAAAVFQGAGPTASKVHWQLDVVDESGRPTGARYPQRKLSAGDFREHALSFGPPFVLSPATSGNAWSRAFLESVMPMPEEPFRWGADTYLFDLAALFGPIGALSDPQSAYRHHPGSGHEARPFLLRVETEVGWYDAILPALGEYAKRLGLDPDERMWRETSWFHRLARAIEELHAVLPAQARVAVGDGGAWGLDDELDGWRFVPFPADRDEHGYAPVDDEHAVAELESLPTRADYFVLAWPAFWWRDSYPGFDARLRERWECLHASGQVQVFRIS